MSIPGELRVVCEFKEAVATSLRKRKIPESDDTSAANAGECPTGGPALPPMIPELVAMRLRAPAQPQSQTARTSRPELQQRPPKHGPCR
ncbi:U-box domain containing protein 32 [Dissostichus eleginoides]|uniref:U-box domain containing protein 32 n=1 Tax=Dissostichus eleginoides TaxID=100907 RepID=A0AAD9FEH3_DISEL|nr:U-box domain containing protein 32 [Dissostichus eleginoides]